MDRALYTSMTGAKHNAIAQTVHANNLANVSTDGFRRDYVAARSMGIWYGDGFPTRAHRDPALATHRDIQIAPRLTQRADRVIGRWPLRQRPKCRPRSGRCPAASCQRR